MLLFDPYYLNDFIFLLNKLSSHVQAAATSGPRSLVNIAFIRSTHYYYY